MSEPRWLWSLGLPADAPLADPLAAGRVLAWADEAQFDLLVLGEMRRSQARPAFDALIVASWLAARTRGVGLVAAVSALHSEPFHVARALSALDFLSAGRSGWMPYALGVDWARYGDAGRVAPDHELPKAIDSIAATQSLWDSWDSDALIIDQASGAYLHADRVRRSDYRGPYHQVQGPLNAARPPQGHPLLVVRDGDPLGGTPAADVCIVGRSAAAATTRSGSAQRPRRLLGLPVREAVDAGLDAAMALHTARHIDGLHLEVDDAQADLEWLAGHALPQWRARGLLRPPAVTATLRERLSLPVPRTKHEQARAGARA